MSVDRQWRGTAIGIALATGLVATGAFAQDGEPDADFLEYLGAWDASDEEWMIFQDRTELAKDESADGDKPPTADDEESTESDDEA